MPADHCLRLENLPCILDLGCQTVKYDEHQPIDVVEDRALRRFTPQHVELMSEHKDLGLQGSLRPEQSDHGIPHQPAEIAHRVDYQPIRRPSSAGLGLR